MIKGHTVIELTDVNTHEKTVIEDDNMVTTALERILKNYNDASGVWITKNRKPFWKTLLGGVVCFDTPQTEDRNTVFPSSDSNAIAYGSYNVKAAALYKNTFLGDFNVEESEYDEKSHTVKLVFDFPTSKGNGSIACVCLTNVCSGYGIGFGCDFDKRSNELIVKNDDFFHKSTSGVNYKVSEKTICTDYVNGYYYNVDVLSSTELQLVKYKGSNNNLTYYETENEDLIALKKTIEIPDSFSGTKPSMMGSFDIVSKHIFVCLYTSLNNNSDIIVKELDLNGTVLHSYSMLNNTGTTWSKVKYFVNNGHLYIWGTPNNKDGSVYQTYISEIGNTANIKLIGEYQDINGGPYNGWGVLCQLDDGFYAFSCSYGAGSSVGNVYWKITPNGIFQTGLATGGYYSGSTGYAYTIPDINEKLMVTLSNGYGRVLLPMYLATINNLPTRVTKTADRTMKLTYIIRETSD